MIKTILKLIMKVLESKLNKSKIEEELLKNKKYISKAKEIWNIVDEDFRISKTIEEQILNKAEKFDNLILSKFPELSKADVAELRQTIAGEVNQGKEPIVNNSELLRQLQTENEVLKSKVSKIQETVAVAESEV